MEALCLDLSPQILLAEDDTELRELLTLVLESAGYRVTPCGDGEQLQRELDRQERIALVISDLRMPKLGGLEVLARHPVNARQIPFICMTAFGDAPTHQQARQLGALAVLDKPFDLDELLDLVEDVGLRNEPSSGRRACTKQR